MFPFFIICHALQDIVTGTSQRFDPLFSLFERRARFVLKLSNPTTKKSSHCIKTFRSPLIEEFVFYNCVTAMFNRGGARHALNDEQMETIETVDSQHVNQGETWLLLDTVSL